MSDLDDIDDETLRDLAALVDGTLPPDRRADVEERVSLDPRLQELVERRLEARTVADADDAQAPSRVHATIEARGRRGAPRPNLALAIGAGAAVLAVLAAVLVVAVSPNTQEVSASAVADIAPRVADQPPPDASAGAVFAGVSFPDWEREFGFAPSGARADTVEGRTVRTVHYDNAAGDRRLVYTIISGPPVEPPEDSSTRAVGGTTVHVFEGPLGPVVTWERDGRTRVLSGDADERTLVALAAWTGESAAP
jgi:hypothetical protein